MMTEEIAKQLVDAMNRLSAALEALQPGKSPNLLGGIQIFHHHSYPSPLTQFPTYPIQTYPLTTYGSLGGGNQQ